MKKKGCWIDQVKLCQAPVKKVTMSDLEYMQSEILAGTRRRDMTDYMSSHKQSQLAIYYNICRLSEGGVRDYLHDSITQHYRLAFLSVNGFMD